MRRSKVVMPKSIQINETYSLNYQFRSAPRFRTLPRASLRSLMERYVDLLWEPGSHKYNVTSFVGELDEILFGAEFSEFTDEMLDKLFSHLRKRGNSNATINRKMAALSKLLRKAHKMGDVQSLPEFKRLKEKAGRIRFLEPDEEVRLFEAIHEKSELYGRFCIFLIDTGARLGEGIGLRWQDIQGERVTFWLTKSGKSRSVPLTLRATEAIRASDSADRSHPLSRQNSGRRGTRRSRKWGSEPSPTSFRISCATPVPRASFRAASTSGACRPGSATRHCR
jgi:integrase